MEKIRKNACWIADIGYLEVKQCMEDSAWWENQNKE